MQQPNEEINSVIVQLQVPADVFPVMFLDECVRTFTLRLLDYIESKFNVHLNPSFNEEDTKDLPSEWRAALSGARSTNKALQGLAMGLAQEQLDLPD
jgi:hypothetical protein